MEIKEIAKKLVDLCRKGKNAEAKSLFYSKDIVSIEPNITYKSGENSVLDEICIYEVKDGKIVFERFFFH